MEAVTDNEKAPRGKIHTNKLKKAELPKGLGNKNTRSTKKLAGAYESDSPVRHKGHNKHVSQSVRKQTNKMSLMNLRASNGNVNVKNRNNNDYSHTGANYGKKQNNVSVQMYQRADQLDSKTKRNQEQRLQNILKMHDKNMQRGVGVANKGFRL